MQLSANKLTKSSIPPRSLSWDWPAAILLLGCVLIASGRLVVTQATDHLILISFLGILGGIAGLALGRSRFPAWLGAIFGFLYGLFFIPWQLGLALFANQEWADRLRDLVGRLSFALTQLFEGENVEDPLLFLAVMAFLFWVISLKAGYRLARRGELWGAVIPFGLVALIVQSYDQQEAWKAWFLAIFLLCVLLLMARLQLLRQRQGWEASHTNLPWELDSNLSTLSFSTAVLLVVLAWVSPTLVSSLDSAESLWTIITTPWRTFQEELGRAFYPLKGEPLQAGFVYGERMLLGRDIPKSSENLFTVQIIQQEQSVRRNYWRDRVYDIYEDGQWASTHDQLKTWETDEMDLLSSDVQSYSPAQFLFIAQSNMVLLHTVPQLVYLDRPATLSFASNDDGSKDFGALFSIDPVLRGESYRVTALISVPTVNQLRNAGTQYPSWVSERYLQLPSDISQRTQELAQTLAEGQETPYDIASAITNYLRREIEYTDRLPAAPFESEPIDWMLFEQKQGFCNYYATAEVVMLRSLGIPARLAVGYAQGEREDLGGRVRYSVRQRDAHAWPEVYFPGIGWVEFEPTANQEPLVRPFVNPQSSVNEFENPEEVVSPPEVLEIEPLTAEEYFKQEEARYFIPSMLFMAALLSLGAALLWHRHRARGGLALATLAERGLARYDIHPPQALIQMARLAELPPLTRAYMQINLALAWLGDPPKFSDTPDQRAKSLAFYLPELNEDIQSLSHDYQTRLFSRSKISREERALRTMRRIHWAARRAQWRKWLEQLPAFIRKR
ncbi:MAG: DUF3488 and transglutaminase-like domain-containing protein [Chloroflexi bacterium]|nr:DUF3488 and transglutaminase-like domain-containing protein [Chloroflexota bacterium]